MSFEAATLLRACRAVVFGASILPALTAAAPSLIDAKAYVIGIYSKIPGDFDYRAVRYSSRLGALLRRDALFSRRSGDVGALDGVPFCDCQDTDTNYRVLSASVTAREVGGAVVSVLLRNGTDQRFTIDLLREQGDWRVADIHGRNMPSFLALLEREVPREEKSLMQPTRRR